MTALEQMALIRVLRAIEGKIASVEEAVRSQDHSRQQPQAPAISSAWL